MVLFLFTRVDIVYKHISSTFNLVSLSSIVSKVAPVVEGAIRTLSVVSSSVDTVVTSTLPLLKLLKYISLLVFGGIAVYIAPFTSL